MERLNELVDRSVISQLPVNGLVPPLHESGEQDETTNDGGDISRGLSGAVGFVPIASISSMYRIHCQRKQSPCGGTSEYPNCLGTITSKSNGY